MSMKEESEKAALKLNIPKTKVMVLSLHGKYKREKKETVTDFIFLGSKITADSDCSHEIKRRLLLGRKTVTNLEWRHYFADKGPCSQSYGFPSSHVPM